MLFRSVLFVATFFGGMISGLGAAVADMECHLRRIHDLRGDEPDGTEEIFKVMISVAAFVTACFPFISFTFLVAMTPTKLLLDLSTYLADCSLDISNAFLRNDLALNLSQRRAMSLKIGSFSRISKETSPFLMKDIVLSQVADTLVGMKQACQF